MQHSASCLAQQAEMKRLHDEYVAKWPNYCRKCGGVGEVTWQENQAPLGSGMVWLEELSDSCPSCLMNGVCPRCRKQIPDNLLVEDDIICPFCKWKLGTAEVCPPAGLEEPCECEYDEHGFGITISGGWIPVDD